MKPDTTMTITTEDGHLRGPFTLDQLNRAAQVARGEQAAFPWAEDEGGDDDELVQSWEDDHADRINAEQLAWQRDSRQQLVAEGAILALSRRVKKLQVKLKAARFMHRAENTPAFGQLVVTYEPRGHQLTELAAARYFNCLVNYTGLPAELVAQVAHDLFITLRPRKLKVVYTSSTHGIETQAEDEREWPSLR